MNGFPGAVAILEGLFVLSVVVTAVGALIAVLTHRVIRSVCGLAICCIGLSGLYYFLGSPFLALMQILIYVGAVCITIIFAVMLAEPDEPPREPAESRGLVWSAVAMLVAALVCWGMARLGTSGPWRAVETRVNDGSLRAMGIELLTTYSLAFETISLVLLVAIVGALAVARGGRTHP